MVDVFISRPADLRKKIAELAGELEDTQDRLNQSVEYNQQLEHTWLSISQSASSTHSHISTVSQSAAATSMAEKQAGTGEMVEDYSEEVREYGRWVALVPLFCWLVDPVLLILMVAYSSFNFFQNVADVCGR